jgi:hypothetical protein
MVTQDEAEALGKALEGTSLSDAPGGFQAVLVGLFGLDDGKSFTLDVDRVALGIRERGLVIVASQRDDQQPLTAHVLVVPFNEVDIEVNYQDPHPGPGWPGQPGPETNVRITARGVGYVLKVEESATPLAWVKALIEAKQALLVRSPESRRSAPLRVPVARAVPPSGARVHKHAHRRSVGT